MSDKDLSENVSDLYDTGYKLKEKILNFLKKWPVNKRNEEIFWGNTDNDHKEAVNNLIIETRQWFNSVKALIVPYTLYPEQHLYYILRQVEAAIKKHEYKRPYPENGTTSMNRKKERLVYYKRRQMKKIDELVYALYGTTE